MKPLIERAKKEGKWLRCSYQDIWFSPSELENAQADGKFRWGPVNWDLFDPNDKVRSLELEIENKKRSLEEFKKRMLTK